MENLEYKYVHYIVQLKKKDIWIKLFRGMYKRRLRKRYEKLKSDFKKGLVEKEAFEIWEQLILKSIT